MSDSPHDIAASDHLPDCRWERTTDVECAYRSTHRYCPHPEHACDCYEQKQARDAKAKRPLPGGTAEEYFARVWPDGIPFDEPVQPTDSGEAS